jgi:hypothetical protein
VTSQSLDPRVLRSSLDQSLLFEFLWPLKVLKASSVAHGTPVFEKTMAGQIVAGAVSGPLLVAAARSPSQLLIQDFSNPRAESRLIDLDSTPFTMVVARDRKMIVIGTEYDGLSSTS